MPGMPDWDQVMKDAMDIGRQQIKKGKEQLAKMKADPHADPAKIKFLETALGSEQGLVDVGDSLIQNADVHQDLE